MDSGPIIPISGMGFAPTTGPAPAGSADPMQFIQQLQSMFGSNGDGLSLPSATSSYEPTPSDPFSELNTLSLFSRIGRSDEFQPAAEGSDAAASFGSEASSL